jgi:S-DNA-T family DNA segregation ATPase FtsK/SpoIIIE
MRTGVLCLTVALTLALASGTLGLGPGAAHAQSFWRPHVFEARGGAVGQAELWIAQHLISKLGAQLLSVFLMIVGAILLTGATLAGIIRVTGEGVAETSRALKRSTEQLTHVRATAPQAATEAGRTGAGTGAEAFDPIVPPEPDTAELVVRATHVEGPAQDTDEEQVVVAPEPERETDSEIPGQQDPELATLTPQGRYRSSVTDDPAFEWKVPAARFLVRSSGENSKPDTAGQEQVAQTLLETLGHFGIQASVIGRVTGPHITRYELRLAPGTKVSKVSQLKDDLAYALAATDIRILAPIPGKQAVGVEVPNARRRIVHLGDVFQDSPADWSPLTVWLGKDIAGRAIGADLAKMPHLLIAGTTGSGKSACVNTLLSSILLRATPHEVRFVLVDPKQVELNHYDSIPHLLTPVITSPRMAANALQNLIKEMEKRYGMMSLARTRQLSELNRARDRRGEPPLPYIVCVIDELADLMMVAPADVEDAVIRLAQKARAVGIHLVLATQSPRVDVITGMIKANVPSRIAFSVSSQTDSRVILDQNGAESLLGQGDMLFSPLGSSKLQRIQGAFIGEEEIAELTDVWRRQGEPEFHEELLEEVESSDGGVGSDELDPDHDELLDDAIALVAQMGTASTSMLQRRLRLGYTRAGRLIDMLERRGIISGYEGSKPRQVLISEADVPRILSHLEEAEGGSRPGRGASEPVTVPDDQDD